MNYSHESDSAPVDLVEQMGSSDSDISSGGGSGGGHAEKIGISRLSTCRDSVGTGDVDTVKKRTAKKDTIVDGEQKKRKKSDDETATRKSKSLQFMDQILEYTTWLLLEHQMFPENEQRMMTRIKAKEPSRKGSPSPETQLESAAQAAINSKDQEALKALLHQEYSKKPNSLPMMSKTPATGDESAMVMGRLFLEACKQGHADIVKFLLEGDEWNLSPNLQDDQGSTPLHYACRAAALNKKSDCLLLLLEEYNCWPQLCLSDSTGKTPLEYMDEASWTGLYNGFLSKRTSNVLEENNASGIRSTASP